MALLHTKSKPTFIHHPSELELLPWGLLPGPEYDLGLPGRDREKAAASPRAPTRSS